MSENNLSYSTEDIMKVLQRAYDETKENRDRALKLYDHMEAAMLSNKGDLVILSQMADRYLEQSSRQTELLVRLVSVMQKLKQFSSSKEDQKSLMKDVNVLLEILDNNKITPFTKGKEFLDEKKLLKKNEENDKSKKDFKENKDEIELETNL